MKIRFSLFFIALLAAFALFTPTASATHTSTLGQATFISNYALTHFQRFNPIFSTVVPLSTVPYAVSMFATLYYGAVCSPACVSPTPYCISGVCKQCTKDANCPSGQTCQSGSCAAAPAPEPAPAPAPSPSPSVCSPACVSPTPYCISGVCKQCTKDANCPSGQTCQSGSCAAAPAPAPSPTPSACSPACASPTPYCISGVCKQCTKDTQCPSGQTCQSGTCSGSSAPAPAPEAGCVTDENCLDPALPICGEGGQCIAEEPPVDEAPPEDFAPEPVLPLEQAQDFGPDLYTNQPSLEEPTTGETEALIRDSGSRCPAGQGFVDEACYSPANLTRCSEELHAKENGVCCSNVWFEGEAACPQGSGEVAANSGGNDNTMLFLGIGAILAILIIVIFALVVFKRPAKPVPSPGN